MCLIVWSNGVGLVINYILLQHFTAYQIPNFCFYVQLHLLLKAKISLTILEGMLLMNRSSSYFKFFIFP